MDTHNEWEDTGVKGGVRGTSCDTLSALILVMTQRRLLVWRVHYFGVHLSQSQNAQSATLTTTRATNAFNEH
jgi:hypothetical protein